MKRRVTSSRTLRAAGSVMDVWPVENYAQYMPKGSDQERIAQHWTTVGSHLRSALSQYAFNHATKR
ncbi:MULTISPECIES: hypothetical protein [Chromohalobacter]|uniref:Uncharacterized protein n=2 Tax=Chromohalobacter TaxID=42054 RepID=A0ABZ0YE87_9GAMM|nr:MULTISPECIES: hypothetical protein [Chromohalobacter]NWO09720.1 hypothetical protein [Chromohalobacter salexigens]MCK0753362.1 hypothetical protein [Chromohalobacter japonicus]MCK0766468.1 hypothetical protein [Chromohalobacter beijerinckii]MCK0769629.1 hypothetical protein [Chromohalobacter canadensis]WQH10409.1 hypothetical protein SR908_06985 [Chromohalobacter canadensis]